MAFPYGAGLLSFLDRYDQAERTAESRRRGELSEALALRQVSDLDRKQREEEQVMGDLAAEIQARRGQPALPSGIGTQVTAGAPIPGAEAALEAGVVQPGVTNVPNIQSTAGLFPQQTPRQPFGASLAPERAARMLAHPAGQRVMKSVEDAEKEAEHRRFKDEAQQFFKNASDRLDAGDSLGAAKELHKAFNRLGGIDPRAYSQASHYIDFALNLSQDAEERKLADEDLKVLSPLIRAVREDPSPTTQGILLDAMGTAKSKTIRAWRLDLTQNQMKSALGKDPYMTMFLKDMTDRFSQAWQAGGDTTQKEVLRAMMTEKPAVFARGIQGLLEGNKELSTAVLEILGVGTGVDPSKLKDEVAQAMQLFKAEHGRGPRTADEFATVYKKADQLAGARKAAETQADPTKKELDQLKLDKARFERDVREGKVVPDIGTLSLYRQRASSAAAEAARNDDSELAESLRVEERYWSSRIADQAKKQPQGKEFGKPKAGSPEAILAGRKLADLPPEDTQALLDTVAKDRFKKMYRDLDKAKRQQVVDEVNELERTGGR